MSNRLLCWFLSPSSSLPFFDWNEDRLLYHAPSSETHFLNPTGACIVDYLNNPDLSASPVCVDELLEHVMQCMEHLSRDDLRGQILALMERLESLGIAVAVRANPEHES